MPQSNVILPLLVPERQLVRSFPMPYNENATPYGQPKDFSKLVRCELETAHRNLKLRPCKVIFVGDVSVGKTTIANRFCYEKFQTNYRATIGVDFEIENFNILGQNFCMEIWDTAGQERFKCIAQSYYRNANIVVVIFDMTKPETLQTAPAWLNSALAVNSIQMPFIFLVGTKSDLLSTTAFVYMEKLATEMAKGLNVEYWAVSARTGFNVVQLFQRMAALAFETACRESFIEREHIERSISAQMRKKSQIFDFHNNLVCRDKSEPPKRSFCLC